MDFDFLADFQTQQDPNQWNGSGGYYGYPQGYENYGYAAAPAGQDPNVYGSYPGYASYQPPQQQQQIGYSWAVQAPIFRFVLLWKLILGCFSFLISWNLKTSFLI